MPGLLAMDMAQEQDVGVDDFDETPGLLGVPGNPVS